MHAHAERGNDQTLNRKIDNAQPALFPAKAGPTKKHTAYTLWDRLQPGSC